MVKIAVNGGEGADSIMKTLIDLLKIADLSVFSYADTKYGTFKQLANNGADVFIAPVSTYLLEQKKSNIDIIIFSSPEYTNETQAPESAFLNGSPLNESSFLNLINENAIIIVNTDDKKMYRYLLGSRANLLTYGFNGKSSITASSVLENIDKNFIQICIQRSFTAINGAIVDAQEIPIILPLNKDIVILNEIAAITAALCLGINAKTISLFSNRVPSETVLL